MARTRLGSAGYGVKRAGSFAGKIAQSIPITRLSSGGYGARRYKASAFAGKAQTAETQVKTDWIIRARRRLGR